MAAVISFPETGSRKAILTLENGEKVDLSVKKEMCIRDRPYRGYPVFSAPDEYLYAIKEAGFDVLLTANNHCLEMCIRDSPVVCHKTSINISSLISTLNAQSYMESVFG